ncbi:hypothetical protein B0H14DRAFT_2556091 [Mycena olivaceomarginata]|nr:hypothetical protein B0H14DRAFT_2556091 [Mycena olivaceomarginata]
MTAQPMRCMVPCVSAVAYSLYSSFKTTVWAAHFVFLPFVSPSAEEITANTLTEQRVIEFNAVGVKGMVDRHSYTVYYCWLFNRTEYQAQQYRLALYNNPVGQLAWIGANIKLWSDPCAGSLLSVLDNTAILTSVSLYHLTDSFLSSVWIYAQNANTFKTVYTKASTNVPLLFRQYEYNVSLGPEEYVAKVGNLVSK